MYSQIQQRSSLREPTIRHSPGRLHSSLLLIACLVPLATACGRKTDPRPPEFVAPDVVVGVNATNVAQGISISWQRPTRYADGSRMLDLAGFQIERSAEGGHFSVITTLWVEDRDRFRQIRKFRYLDDSVAEGQTYRYRIISFTGDDYFSEPSEVVELLRETPPAPSG